METLVRQPAGPSWSASIFRDGRSARRLAERSAMRVSTSRRQPSGSSLFIFASRPACRTPPHARRPSRIGRQVVLAPERHTGKRPARPRCCRVRRARRRRPACAGQRASNVAPRLSSWSERPGTWATHVLANVSSASACGFERRLPSLAGGEHWDGLPCSRARPHKAPQSAPAPPLRGSNPSRHVR